MAAVALADIRRLARLYADERPAGNSAFITDDDVDLLINLRIRELYDMLVGARGHEFYETVDDARTTTAGVATIGLPTDFYQLLSLELRWSAVDIEPLEALESIDDRAYYSQQIPWTRGGDKAFRLLNGSIEFFPTPTATTMLRVRYVPQFADLVADAETFDSVNGWHKLVALGVAQELCAIGNKSPGQLPAFFETERARVEQMAGERAAAHPARVRDVRYGRHGGARFGWRRLGVVP